MTALVIAFMAQTLALAFYVRRLRRRLAEARENLSNALWVVEQGLDELADYNRRDVRDCDSQCQCDDCLAEDAEAERYDEDGGDDPMGCA